MAVTLAMRPKADTLLVCRGTGCESSRSDRLQAALETEVARAGLDHVRVQFTGCHGFCEYGPIVTVEPQGVFYTRVTPHDTPEIVESRLEGDAIVERLVYRDPATGEAFPYYRDIPFYARQQRVVLRRCGHICPEEIDDYVADDGYQALRKALFEMTPEQVVAEITRAGLRGRGGAGFSTGLKWQFLRRAEGQIKYVVCNLDEGDPGAFINRSEAEGDPHAILEGMVIAAYAVGAQAGYIYGRSEYPLAIRRLRRAIAQAEERGYLGDDILGSGLSFRVTITEGAGAFVCGEETALLASIEGRRGMPRPRPPFPTQSGLWGRPTLINNVGTLANVPPIVLRGAAWYAGMGTERCRGTMVFSLVGKVANSGLVEVPMGATLREIVMSIGGGVPGGKAFKAVQTGGPSGGCLPAELLDLPVEYETLAEAGSIMGSGGMVVMDEDTCMVDVARFFLSFTQHESCGKCVPCRLGAKRMLEILERIVAGRGEEGDIDLLLELAETVRLGSLCGLGQTAPNPVLSTIRYFRDEYEAHIRDRRCPALACEALITYRIDPARCQGCGRCARVCPVGAIAGERLRTHAIDPAACARCGACLEACPQRFGAVTKVSGEALPVSAALSPAEA